MPAKKKVQSLVAHTKSFAQELKAAAETARDMKFESLYSELRLAMEKAATRGDTCIGVDYGNEELAERMEKKLVSVGIEVIHNDRSGCSFSLHWGS